MVPLQVVQASNTRLRELGPGLVAVFVGGTSGIGEAVAKTFVHKTISPRVYLVGRSDAAATRIIGECSELNKDAKVEFIRANVTELAEVDRVCKEIAGKEEHVNLLIQSQGNLTLRGRDESPEGLDRKFTLNYYSRMRFIANLQPLLHAATTKPPHFSRALSILGAGTERAGFDFEDIDLKKSFSGMKCANHTIVMNSFMTEEFSKREPGTTFVHSAPGIVLTPISRDLPLWGRIGWKLLTPIIYPFTVSPEETGQRQLYLATSGMFPPLKPSNGPTSSGVPISNDQEVAKGLNEASGSGSYLANWKCDITGSKKLLDDYREKGMGQTAWDHTMAVFDRVEEINRKAAQETQG